MEEVNVIKRGENVIMLQFNRSKLGLSVNVKVHPEVEDFFRTISNGEVGDLRWTSRLWTGPKTGEVEGMPVYEPLMMYGLPDQFKGSMPLGLETGSYYRLDTPGKKLITEDPETRGSRVINLSFLRLVGASQGTGVRFQVRDMVYELGQLRELAGACRDASRRFYTSYLLPADLTVFVSTQEL